jgi:methionyl-tRNA formyltransferase
MSLRLIMVGTGEFALPTFERLLASPHQVVALLTQPDRTGPGKHNHPHPMKERAIAAGVPVLQPTHCNTPEFLAELRALNADLMVVAAYGQILSADFLTTTRLGAINLHASLLPKHRGAAPIQYAVWKGESETGVTIFQIQPRLDAGPILGVVKTPIGPQETAGELEVRLADLGAALAMQVVDEIEHGTTKPTVQDPTGVTKAPKMPKAAGLIDWSKTTQEIGWHLRAMQPWPMPYSFLKVEGRPPLRLLVLEVESAEAGNATDPPGTVLVSDGARLIVKTSDGAAAIQRLQPAGKKPMTVAEFLRGNSIPHGAVFGTEN